MYFVQDNVILICATNSNVKTIMEHQNKIGLACQAYFFCHLNNIEICIRSQEYMEHA